MQNLCSRFYIVHIYIFCIHRYSTCAPRIARGKAVAAEIEIWINDGVRKLMPHPAFMRLYSCYPREAYPIQWVKQSHRMLLPLASCIHFHYKYRTTRQMCYYNTMHVPYLFEKFVILIFVMEKIFVQVYSNPDKFPVSNFRHLTFIFITSDRKQHNLPQKGCVWTKYTQSTTTLFTCDSSFFHKHEGVVNLKVASVRFPTQQLNNGFQCT